MNIKVENIVTLRQIDAISGKVVSETKPQRNLIFDNGLNALARSTNATYPAEATACIRVGSGSTADKVSSGGITFTQSGNTITANAGFFTSGMIGWLFKYGSGTGGAEYYITGFTDSTHITVDTSATVSTPTVGTVWNVIRSTLETLLYSSSSYETVSGACQTTFAANVATHKRTINFAQQGSAYNVNEVGYFRTTTGTTIFGRIVLAATEVVNPTNFLQVVMEFVVTYLPASPLTVANVGTNIDTAGKAMLEQLIYKFFGIVQANGDPLIAQGNALDGSGYGRAYFPTATYSQAANTGTSPPSWSARVDTVVNMVWTFTGTRGTMQAASGTIITTSGQTIYGVGFALDNPPYEVGFDIKFDTPFVLPTGSFLPQITWKCVYNRTLSN